MIWEKQKSKFHVSWHKYMQPFIESTEYDEIFAYLKQRKEEGAEIAPLSFNLFKAFRDTNLNELKAVIIGENPSNIFTDGIPNDSGVLFESVNGMSLTLQEFYNGIERELYNGLNLNIIYDDLSYLTSQGVLMIPSSLTIEKDSEKGHNKIWKPFIEYLLSEIIAPTGVPILFLGKSKQYMEEYEQSNYCYSLALPTIGNVWDTKEVFSNINENIWSTNEETIMWLNIIEPF
jgi:uracil-DNA glycosylase